jgi:hypothetical protein
MSDKLQKMVPFCVLLGQPSLSTTLNNKFKVYQTPSVERTAVAGSSLANQLFNVPQGVCS